MAECSNFDPGGDAIAFPSINAPRGSKKRTQQIIDQAHREETAGTMRAVVIATKGGVRSDITRADPPVGSPEAIERHQGWW